MAREPERRSDVGIAPRSTPSTGRRSSSSRHAPRRAYDFKSGKEIWRLSGGGYIPCRPRWSARPDLYHQRSRTASPVYAIRETASGDVSLTGYATINAGVAWSVPRDGGYMCTPLVYRGLATS